MVSEEEYEELLKEKEELERFCDIKDREIKRLHDVIRQMENEP